jgi:hypothetical protein
MNAAPQDLVVKWSPRVESEVRPQRGKSSSLLTHLAKCVGTWNVVEVTAVVCVESWQTAILNQPLHCL